TVHRQNPSKSIRSATSTSHLLKREGRRDARLTTVGFPAQQHPRRSIPGRASPQGRRPAEGPTPAPMRPRTRLRRHVAGSSLREGPARPPHSREIQLGPPRRLSDAGPGQHIPGGWTMRDDFHEVIIERPRAGRRIKEAKGYKRSVARIPMEERPLWE